MDKLTVTLIIPCYNEEKVLDTTYTEIQKLRKRESKYQFQILFIDDGSTDKTLEKILAFASKDKMVRVLSFSRNFGHQAAITAGINHTSTEIAVILDADLQDPVEVIPKMIEKFKSEKCEVVYGVRKIRKQESFFKKFSAAFYYRLLNLLSERPIPADTGDFRLIGKKVIDDFKQLREKNKYIRGLISWIGYKQVPIYYDRNPRFTGKTKYPLSKMLKFAFTGIFYFSKTPLTVALNLGFISITIGIIATIYVLLSNILRPEKIMSGWTSIMIAIIFFGGVQLITIGMLGQYIGNIFDEVKGRPEYIINEKINFDL